MNSPTSFQVKRKLLAVRSCAARKLGMHKILAVVIATACCWAASVSAESDESVAHIPVGSWTSWSGPIILTISKSESEGKPDKVTIVSKCNQREGLISYSKSAAKIVILITTPKACQPHQCDVESLVGYLASGRELKLSCCEKDFLTVVVDGLNIYFSKGDKFMTLEDDVINR